MTINIDNWTVPAATEAADEAVARSRQNRRAGAMQIMARCENGAAPRSAKNVITVRDLNNQSCMMDRAAAEPEKADTRLTRAPPGAASGERARDLR